MQTASKPGKEIDPESFVNHPQVLDCLNTLREKFGENYEHLLVSDTLDDQNHQYVHLVQKGGGVLGVALVGYTYILEAVGIRFLRLAGTSAGAINTALLVVVGKKEEAKSEKILKYICDLNFFDLVDGHPFARWLIKKLITNKKFETEVKNWLSRLVFMFFTLVFADIVLLEFKNLHWAYLAAHICLALTAIHILLILGVIGYIKFLFGRLKDTGHGINPGKFFLEWAKKVMDENGVSTVTDLNKKAGSISSLSVRNPKTQNADTLTGDVTFITSELVSENKIEFPGMADLFRENPDDLHPANFVRASMSIPIFFESHIINDIPVKSSRITAAWVKHFGSDERIPDTARFVDGGMLSDFPINIFYNPKVIEPRLPSWGIDLDDSDPDANNKVVDPWGLTGYLGRLFNTIRYYYDKDFLIKNNVFKKGIGKIPLYEFNWLNFFISDEDKLKMFVRGAIAARDFLLGFDWPQYQAERTQMQIILNETHKPEDMPKSGAGILTPAGMEV
jgi:NTE family protein